MTDDERITLRELLAAEIKTLRDDVHDVKADVKAVKEEFKNDMEEMRKEHSGLVSWRALGAAFTVGVSTAGFLVAVVNHA